MTAVSEVMAALCLAKDLDELKTRMGRFIVGYGCEKNPVFARDLKAQGAMAMMLRDATKPKLVQTIEGTPTIVHGGPFTNIAHGTNTVIANEMGLKMPDYVVTKAGFGFDIGGEKFFHISCRLSGLSLACIASVAMVRALKMHGGIAFKDLKTPDADYVRRGPPNLERHVESALKFRVPMMLYLNRFTQDTDVEIQVVLSRCQTLGVETEVTTVWRDGGAEGIGLAQRVLTKVDAFHGSFTPLCDLDASVEDKIETIAQAVYGARGVHCTKTAQTDLKRIARIGLTTLPICMAKT